MRQVTFQCLSLCVAIALGGCSGGSNTAGSSADDAGNSADGTTGASVNDASDSDVAKILPGALSVTACPGISTTTVPSNAPSCDTICGAAHCEPAALATDPSLPDCPDDGTGIAGRCVPDLVYMWEGHFRGPPCTSSIVKGPAACVPYCFTGIFKDVLKRDSCAAGEVCSPCTNPTTNQPTGACTDRCEDEGGLDGAPSDDAGSVSDANVAGDATDSGTSSDAGSSTDATPTTDASDAGSGGGG